MSLAAIALAACGTADASGPALSRPAVVWRESFHENFAVDLADTEAECIAGEVRELTTLVGPLVGQRPDDTTHSIWAAVDHCLSPATQGALARAIVYGGWSGDEPALADVWQAADERLSSCVNTAGGWQALGSYTALMATCGRAGAVAR